MWNTDKPRNKRFLEEILLFSFLPSHFAGESIHSGPKFIYTPVVVVVVAAATVVILQIKPEFTSCKFPALIKAFKARLGLNNHST